ncbi:MAG: SIS domain-containing protein [Patescibacteria group bacterium]|nr:SIS domain-containing protein [Patescibacteria group bacterium]
MPTKKRDYHMLREIEEQPAAIDNLIKKYVEKNQVEMKEFREFKKKLRNIRRFSFWGIGSSFHAAMYADYLFEDLCSVPCECERADELIIRKDVLEKDTAVVVISQSGETSDLIEAVKKAKMQKVLTIGIINSKDSSLGSLLDVALNIEAGEEKALAATKAFSSQLFTLFLLAVYYNQFRSRCNEDLLAVAKELPRKISRIIKQKKEIQEIAKKYKGLNHLTVLGRHWHYPIAEEVALKCKETAYLDAEGMATETFRHGPAAVIDENFVSLIFLPKNKNYDENVVALEETIRAKGKTIAVANEETKKVKDQIVIPKIDSVLQPLLSVVAGQYFAYFIALERGLDIDNPRNIFKFIKK